MTVHFAPSRAARFDWVRRRNRAVPLALAANDNAEPAPRADQLDSALRYFAAHGLGAAGEAANAAEAAWTAGDRAGWEHWLAICRTLEPRVARALVKRINAGNRLPRE